MLTETNQESVLREEPSSEPVPVSDSPTRTERWFAIDIELSTQDSDVPEESS